MMLLALFAMALGPLVSVHVDTQPSHRIQTIRPLRAIGSSIDSDERGKIPLLYSPDRVHRMLQSGLGTITYRLYTELSIQDWHWNPSGTFSDAANHQGYWTSSPIPGPRIVDSFGYVLPHRGSTHDQGDENGYSRIDDGNPKTYWKSNPYLSPRPQWIVIDLGVTTPVDTVNIGWTNPYATKFRLEYWKGAGDAIVDQANGGWVSFPKGEQSNRAASTQSVRLTDAPLNVRWIRLLMTQSSNTCDTHGASDRRNCVGFAVEDVAVGTDGNGRFHDLVNRSTCGGNPDDESACKNHQTTIWTSSTDPWHSAGDQIQSGQDQPGLDIATASGISRALPMIYAVPMFYSTPENAANMVRYLEARKYPIAFIELGEEVDGQYALPEDYADLYMQFAKAIHAVDPRVKLGGPIFSGFNTDLTAWRDTRGNVSWFGRFVSYLRDRGRLGDLQFMSFEHYPFHACDEGDALQDDLLREPALVRGMVDIWHADGLPKQVPLLITESNFAADGGSQPQRVEGGALWLADYIGTAMSSGISYTTYYQYEAEPLKYKKPCDRWGSYGMFLVDNSFSIRSPGASFYGAQMLTKEWLQAGDAPHGIYPVSVRQPTSRPLVTAYAAQRPGGSWSILVDNKDFVARPIALSLGSHAIHSARSFATFGIEQFVWSSRSPDELPSPDSGISHASLLHNGVFVMPPRSISVLRM